jgi:hypothetical protein
MANFAHIVDGVVVNVIVANSIDDAEIVCGAGNCIEYHPTESPVKVNEKIDTKLFGQSIEKRKAEKKAIADAEEKIRIKGIEAENERLRKLEADRVLAEEASKPKPVTGIFVKVEKN